MAVCPRWDQESWYQCLGTQDGTLLKPLPAPSDAETPRGSGSAIWQKRRLDVSWGCAGGFSVVVCFGRDLCHFRAGVLWCRWLLLQAMLSFSSTALEVPMHIADTNE